MKKFMYQDWKENSEYIRTHILPRLQEVQRDMYASDIFTVDLSVNMCGGVTFSIIARENPDNNEITATVYFSFFYTRNAKYNEKMYKGIAGFIKKHSA